MQVLSSRIK